MQFCTTPAFQATSYPVSGEWRFILLQGSCFIIAESSPSLSHATHCPHKKAKKRRLVQVQEYQQKGAKSFDTTPWCWMQVLYSEFIKGGFAVFFKPVPSPDQTNSYNAQPFSFLPASQPSSNPHRSWFQSFSNPHRTSFQLFSSPRFELRLRVSSTGDTTPIRMTGVTLHSHVHCKEI